jgi:hypothetical protein
LLGEAVERDAVERRVTGVGLFSASGAGDPGAYRVVIVTDVRDEAVNSTRASAVDQLAHQPAADPAALPLVVDLDRDLRRAGVARKRDVASDADDLTGVGRDRGERLVMVMVDVGEGSRSCTLSWLATVPYRRRRVSSLRCEKASASPSRSAAASARILTRSWAQGLILGVTICMPDTVARRGTPRHGVVVRARRGSPVRPAWESPTTAT